MELPYPMLSERRAQWLCKPKFDVPMESNRPYELITKMRCIILLHGGAETSVGQRQDGASWSLDYRLSNYRNNNKPLIDSQVRRFLDGLAVTQEAAPYKARCA